MAYSELPTPPRPSDAGPSPSGAPKPRSLRALVFTYLPFALSALWAAIIVRLLIKDVRYAIPMLVLAALWVLPLYVMHRRQRALLLRGNAPDVLEAWTPMLERTPNPETMQPLLMATAYAANGWTDAAREALGRAHRGPAWAQAREQRLMVDVLLEAFDGDRAHALRLADDLAALPMPQTGIFLRRRVLSLRHGVGALVRAFNRCPEADDRERLLAARKASPLFFWAFTYAAAILAVDANDAAATRELLAGAPQWSPSSVFANFQRELATEIERIEAIRGA